MASPASLQRLNDNHIDHLFPDHVKLECLRANGAVQ
jgi:hypothetical protein